MENINTLLRHESGHAKYTDFRSMIEGQKQAKTDGYLPTSFWLLFEGMRIRALISEREMNHRLLTG
jgi:hypothetical protein